MTSLLSLQVSMNHILHSISSIHGDGIWLRNWHNDSHLILYLLLLLYPHSVCPSSVMKTWWMPTTWLCALDRRWCQCLRTRTRCHAKRQWMSLWRALSSYMKLCFLVPMKFWAPSMRSAWWEKTSGVTRFIQCFNLICTGRQVRMLGIFLVGLFTRPSAFQSASPT